MGVGKKTEKIMVFGVFDRLHKGHIFFLNKAKEYGNELVIVLAQDSTTKEMKGYLPKENIGERMKKLELLFPTANIIKGDKELKSWNMIKNLKPNLIITGYDQKELYTALEGIKDIYGFKLEMIGDDHEGDSMHSSLI
jgi:FAD synthetase